MPSFATTGILQADTALQAAERAGKEVVSVEWVGARGLNPALQGPVVDFRSLKTSASAQPHAPAAAPRSPGEHRGVVSEHRCRNAMSAYGFPKAVDRPRTE